MKDGSLAIEDVDRNVRRMLEYIVRTPSFAKYKYSNKPDLKAHAQVARKAAGESMVLLRNEGALPLKGDEKVALYGISALDFVAGGTGSGDVNKAYVVNMEEAMENAGFQLDKNLSDYYKAYIAYDKAQNALSGTVFSWFTSRKLAEIAIPAAAIANEAKVNDVAVVVLGRNAGEGADRRQVDDFELTSVERDLLRDVSTAYHTLGKKVVVVLNIGGVIETNSWKNLVDAIVRGRKRAGRGPLQDRRGCGEPPGAGRAHAGQPLLRDHPKRLHRHRAEDDGRTAPGGRVPASDRVGNIERNGRPSRPSGLDDCRILLSLYKANYQNQLWMAR